MKLIGSMLNIFRYRKSVSMCSGYQRSRSTSSYYLHTLPNKTMPHIKGAITFAFLGMTRPNLSQWWANIDLCCSVLRGRIRRSPSEVSGNSIAPFRGLRRGAEHDAFCSMPYHCQKNLVAVVLQCPLCELKAPTFYIDQHEMSKDPARPNVVIVLADNLGWGELGCYSVKRSMAAPFIGGF